LSIKCSPLDCCVAWKSRRSTQAILLIKSVNVLDSCSQCPLRYQQVYVAVDVQYVTAKFIVRPVAGYRPILFTCSSEVRWINKQMKKPTHCITNSLLSECLFCHFLSIAFRRHSRTFFAMPLEWRFPYCSDASSGSISISS
jgi:hypothetical protein